MAKENFSAHMTTFNEVIDNSKKYQIPPYQRDYSWEEAHWNQLWEDILSNDKEHFLGILVLQEERNQVIVIDGQQRITTILLIILMCIYILNDKIKELSDEKQKEVLEKRIKILSEKYIGKEDPEDLKHYNKLKLNKQNDKCFSQLCEISTMEQGEAAFRTDANDSQSNILLKKAAKFFYKKLKELFSQSSSKEIVSFIKKNIESKLIFTEIMVSSSENAFILFESLNSRALSLTSYDLLKNHLLSKCAKSKISSMQSSLEEITEKINKEDISRFITLAWNISHLKAPRNRIFRVISKEITTGSQAFAYLKELQSIANIYKKIQNGTISEDKKINDMIQQFQMFGNVRQHYMILIPLFMKYKTGLLKIVKTLFNITMRYNYICNGQANRQEKVYNAIGQKIYSQNYVNTSAILKDLKSYTEICVTDDKLRTSLLEKEFIKENVDRFILCAIEKEYIPSVSLSEREYTIEHISDRKYHKNFTNKLGNLTLLFPDENGKLQDKKYEKKKEYYQQKTLHILKNITADVWNEQAVENRGIELAEKFLEAFKI